MAWLATTYHQLWPSRSPPAYSPIYSDVVDGMPLLPTNGVALEENTPEFSNTRPTRRGQKRNVLHIAAIFVALIAGFLLRGFTHSWRESGNPSDPITTARQQIDALYAQQSTTLPQARARYSLKTNREPPEHYDDWYKFAQEKKCLIDDYDQIHRDFEVFYQLAKDDPKLFKRMLDKGIDKAVEIGDGLKPISISKGKMHMEDNRDSFYNADWENTFKEFSSFLPDMKFILSWQDEPRVVFNYRDPDAHALALNQSIVDAKPFQNTPYPTVDFYGPKGERRCLLPTSKIGLGDLVNDRNAFLLGSATTRFTTDLYPILSMAKISPCFSDILVPSMFYYRRSGWYPRYSYPDNVAWSDKKSLLYWRGASSGGMIDHTNYRSFPRFTLISIARNHTDIIDAAITSVPGANCQEACDSDAVKVEFGIRPQSAPREGVYQYKYVFDVDGNSFSGRYFGLLKSGSLVFKSTVFEEYFNDWIIPYVHYIPVLPDLSDLVEKVEWAIAHDEEARRIQEAGKQFAERVMTDAQNDCYFFAVLLEYARLQNMADGVDMGGGKEGS